MTSYQQVVKMCRQEDVIWDAAENFFCRCFFSTYVDPADAGLEPQLLHRLVRDGQAAAGRVIVRHHDQIKLSEIYTLKTPWNRNRKRARSDSELTQYPPPEQGCQATGRKKNQYNIKKNSSGNRFSLATLWNPVTYST